MECDSAGRLGRGGRTGVRGHAAPLIAAPHANLILGTCYTMCGTFVEKVEYFSIYLFIYKNLSFKCVVLQK